MGEVPVEAPIDTSAATAVPVQPSPADAAGGTTGTDAVVFDPFAPGYAEDPYAQYRVLRELDPVHRTALGPWILTRYDDVVRVLRDPTLSVEEAKATPLPVDEHRRAIVGERSNGGRAMLNLDPPDHDRLRRLVSKAFTPRTVESLRPRVRELVDEALDAVAPPEMEVIAELAFPLPFTVISEMLGMPEGHRDELRSWSHTVVKTLDPIITDDELRAAVQAGDAMTEHVRDVVAWKRRHPADDLLTALLAAEDEGDVLGEQELLDQVMLLYIAGHETTVNLIGNGTLALLRHPDQLERVRHAPDLDANAVEELLRYDSPVQFSRRITLAPLPIAGRVIEAGCFVLTCLGSANRDPARWGEGADALDLGRAGAGAHVSFGSGIHHCLGAALARTEAQCAIPALARRFPRMELVEPPVWNGRIVLRGLDRLRVAL